MSETLPESLGEWMKEWLHPRAGAGEWTRSLSGADADAIKSLGELTRLRDSEL